VQRDLVDHQVAIGVFVIILNRNVTGLHNLSTSQIQGMYTGVYQNWQQICDNGHCGPNLPIVPISRTVNSGTRFTFEKYILKGVATVPGIGLERATSSGNAVQEVESNSGSIGYAPLYLASQAKDVITVSIDGQDPHNFSLIQRDVYQFWNIEHMYTRGQGSPLAQSFINYMYSDLASNLIANFGFLHLADIPQNIRDKHVLEAQ
jgi:phosphate transport system substrate-binding protein